MKSLPPWLRDRRVALCVFVGTLLWVAAVYVVIVLGGGVLIGHTDSPQIALSVLATAIVALGFEPVRTWLDDVAGRWVHGGRRSPYDVLSQFSESLAGVGDGDEQPELPMRMARLLAEGTGARWAQVWLMVDDEPELAAAWPPEEPSASSAVTNDPRVCSLDVRLDDELLGMLRVMEHDDQPLSPVEDRLFTGLAAQAGLVLRGVRLRAELARRATELSARADELQVSRQRLVDTHDAERRRLERDIHDGAQQHLVALVVNLRLAQTLAGRSPERVGPVLQEQVDAVDSAITTLVELSRGIYPRVLGEQGVAVAVRNVVTTSAIPVSVVDRGFGRYPEDLEAALYFCSVEAVQNAVKHASASRVEVELATHGDHVTLRVRDDGIGFDADAVTAAGGLGNLRDRVDAVGGELTIRAAGDVGTEVLVSVPVPVPVPVSGG